MTVFHADSILIGLVTLRRNPMRTILSTLGVIIGVAALVAVLSLGESLEAFSRLLDGQPRIRPAGSDFNRLTVRNVSSTEGRGHRTGRSDETRVTSGAVDSRS